MTGTAGSIRITGHGFAVLPAVVDLQPTASGTWTDTGLEVMLPVAGVYHLDATVRAALTGQSPVNTYVVARLLDVTAGVVVPNSEVLITQINISASPAGTLIGMGENGHASIAVPCTVPGARLVRLQAARFNSVDASNAARIISDGNGRTTLRYERVA